MKKACLCSLMLIAVPMLAPPAGFGVASPDGGSNSIKRQLKQYTGTVVSLEELAKNLGYSADKAFRTALYADKLVVDLYAPWCGPCNALAPALERMASKRKDTLFLKVNIDQYPQISKKYAVRSIPTVLCFRNGQQAGRVTGNNTREIESKAASL